MKHLVIIALFLAACDPKPPRVVSKEEREFMVQYMSRQGEAVCSYNRHLLFGSK
jgi:hypothetical protein